MMLVTLVMKGDGFRYASETRDETKTSEGLLGVSSRCSAITELSNTIRDTESMLNEQSRILEMAVKNI